MSLLAVLKLPPRPATLPSAQPQEGVVGRDAEAFERAKKLRDGMKDQLEKGWREAVDIATRLDPGVKKAFVVQLQQVDKKRQEAKRLDGDPPGQVVRLAEALISLKQARQAVGMPVHDGTDANTAYKSADGSAEVSKPESFPAAPPPIVAKKEAAEQEAAGNVGAAGADVAGVQGSAHAAESTDAASRKRTTHARKPKPATSGGKAASSNATLVIDSFAFGKPDVPGSRLAELQALSRRLAADPGSTVRLVGHTDTVGTERNNQILGTQRAKAVRALLIVDKGVNAGHIQLESAGETQPAAGEGLAKRDPDKGERNAKNRRVEVFVTWSKSTPVEPEKKTPQKNEPAARPPVDDGHPTGGRVGTTFEHQWDSPEFGKWGTAYVKGAFKLKAKIKGEVVQNGGGQKVTAGYTTNKGMKLLFELGKQEAVKILEGFSLKEVKETFEPEFSAKKVELKFSIKASMATGVPWLTAVVVGSFVIVGVDWKKIAKDQGDFQVATFLLAGGAQGKGTVSLGDGWEANLYIDLLVEGSAGPNWPAIIARVAAGAAADVAEGGAAAEVAADGAAETAAGAVSFEVLIASGAAILGASVIAGTLKSMIDGEEIRQLSGEVDKATNGFRRGFAAGMLGEKASSDPVESAGYKLGVDGFAQAKRAALAKYPLSDKEIRSALRKRLRESWKQLWWLFHPYAQQAVWDAFGSSHVGFVNRNIDSTTVRWGYVAIYGQDPSESDPNYQKYYLK